MKKFTNQQLDELHDEFVDLHNTLLDLGYTEPDVLHYMLVWIKGSINLAKEYGYYDENYPEDRYIGC